MGTTTRTHPGFSGEDGVLKLLLAAAIALPALAFRTASYHGEVVAVLYREPKKDAITILFWALVFAFLWLKGRRFDRDRLASILTDPSVVVLALLLGYFSLTRLWVTVPANWGYEMSQYALLFLVLLVLLAWTTVDPTIPALVEKVLVASIGVIVGIGMIQGFWPGVAPPPINPFGEVGNPSLMGYKNPAALSVLAQVFLLAGLVWSRLGGSVGRTLFAALLAMEITYLIGLESRTALFSLVVGAVVLTGLSAMARNHSFGRILFGVAAAALIAAAGFGLSPSARAKAVSAATTITQPRLYLNTDRGTFFLNTLNMVKHHPFGVGIGDWQTMYPIHRSVDRETAFDDRFQVRRAHSDHVQILGEGGWPGLVLWAGLLIVLFSRSAAAAVRRKDHQAVFLAAQIAALSAAMTTDFFTEIPYNKLQFFLLVFLVVSRTTTRQPEKTGALPRGPWMLVAGLITLAAVGGIAMAIQTETKLIDSATSTALFLKASEPGTETTISRRLLNDGTAIGNRWISRPGHWKSLFRDHLALAWSEASIDQRQRARRQAIESLQLQPFNPQALRLMANLSENPTEAIRWSLAADHIEASSGSGFRIHHPLGVKYSAVTE